MKSATQIVWGAAGEIAMPDCSEMTGRCWLCGGEVARGALVKKWLPSGFTDHARVAIPTSDVVCEPCVFICSRVSPVPGRPPGKCSCCDGTLVIVTPRKGEKAGDPCTKCEGTGLNASGGNYRNYSHLYEGGRGYANASKGEKPLIREFLEREKRGPWFACIADSGQKHVLPFARWNGPGVAGVVLFDEQLIQVPRDTSAIAGMVELLTEGVTKEEIETGDYTHHTMYDRREAVERFEAQFGKLRGSGWFTLSIWIAQRDEEEHARRKAERKEKASAEKSAAKKRERPNGERPKKTDRNRRARDGARDSESIRSKRERQGRAQLLGAAPEPRSSIRHDDRQRERVGQRDAERATRGQPEQLGLPGLAGAGAGVRRSRRGA